MGSIAFFVTPHGFGHAARAAAVMQSVAESNDSIRFEIFTEIPRWFFEQSVSAPFGYHRVLTDIGFVQTSPFQEDLAKTVDSLAIFFPPPSSLIDGLAEKIKRLECRLIVCDIAPLGIAVSKKAEIASALVENFTWDWIYRTYTRLDKRIGRYADYLEDLFSSADWHIQTEYREGNGRIRTRGGTVPGWRLDRTAARITVEKKTRPSRKRSRPHCAAYLPMGRALTRSPLQGPVTRATSSMVVSPRKAFLNPSYLAS